MESRLEAAIWRRAHDRCEYCQLCQSYTSLPLEIDHIIARKHGGKTELDNLALSCFYCNSYKGSNVAGVDPIDGAIVRLYNPRSDIWGDHFEWKGPLLVARTAIGRVTIAVLVINHPDAIVVRESLIQEGIFPPASP